MAKQFVLHKGPPVQEEEPKEEMKIETTGNNFDFIWLEMISTHNGQEHRELVGNKVTTTNGTQQLSGGLFVLPVRTYVQGCRYRMMKNLADIFIREKWARALSEAEIHEEIK
jgi:hypothetical protein